MCISKEGEKVIITGDPNYLIHHGVKGMKWGVRKKTSSGRSSNTSSKIKKIAKNQAKKHVEKREEKTKQLQKTVDTFGVSGTALGRYMGYKWGHAERTTIANMINMSANAYIAAGSNYRVARGVDFVRRASISSLSIKDTAEKINAFADVGKAAIYASNKKSNK